MSTPGTELKHAKFIEKYLQCFNATLAAQEAGYSAKTAYSSGSRLLKNVEIRAEIERRLSELGMGKSEVIARLADHARGDMSEFVRVIEKRDDGKTTRVLVEDLAGAAMRGSMRLVRKIKFGAKGEVTIELYDAQKALGTLAHVHGLVKRGGDESDGWDDDETEERQERAIGDDEILVEAELARAL